MATIVVRLQKDKDILESGKAAGRTHRVFVLCSNVVQLSQHRPHVCFCLSVFQFQFLYSIFIIHVNLDPEALCDPLNAAVQISLCTQPNIFSSFPGHVMSQVW